MRITFVAIGSEQLAIGLLSALAKQHGHTVGLAFSAGLFDDRYNLHLPWLARRFDDTDRVVRDIVAQAPDVIACSALTGTYRWLLDVVGRARAQLPGVKVIFGGVHPSAVPERVLARPEIDAVCVGEGEHAFIAWLDALSAGFPGGAIANLRYHDAAGALHVGKQSGFNQDLDTLPLFDKALWEPYIRVSDIYMTMATRGCPYRCTFCFNNFWAELPEGRRGRYVRLRSPEHVMGELRLAKRRYNVRLMSFEDDIFTVDKAWLRRFLAMYKAEIGLPFQCLTHPGYVDDEVVRLLADAGCGWVQMGVQSADESFKYETLRRYEKTAEVERALELFIKYGVRCKVDHMFGLPGEPVRAQETAKDMYARFPPARIQTFWTQLLPGTQMLAEARAAGTLAESDAELIEEGLSGNTYHVPADLRDPLQKRRFLSYEALFRAMPLLPGRLRRKVRAGSLDRLPAGLVEAGGRTADLVNAIKTINPDMIAYGRHYAYHLAKEGLLKIGAHVPSATTPRQGAGVWPSDAPSPLATAASTAG